jgi:hypothetical protein
MAKAADVSVLDALLDKVGTATQLLVTSSQPANRAAAITAALATVNLSGAFTKSAGTPNGRKTTIAQQANAAVAASGTATHVCLIDGTTLLYVTTVTSQALTSGNTVTIPAWTITVGDPS